MQKKVLFVATVDSHIRFFHLPYLQYFKEQGYEVHVATNGEEEFSYCDVKHQVPMTKSPFCLCNIKGYKMLKQLIEQEEFAIIHCHMPVGGALTRLAARKKRKSGTKVIYTAHGFHFYKRAPLLNWLLYYPVEKYLARYTDCLITINKEDYQRAQKHKFKAGHIEHVHGVGVNLDKFKPIIYEEKQRLRRVYGYQEEDVILIYVAELNKNKNQRLLLESIPLLNQKIPHLKVILVGQDLYEGRYQNLSKDLKIEEQVNFLGERKDIPELLGLSDLYIATSKREGLPLNIMEAMAMGIPICATANRGHNELIQDGVNGNIVESGDALVETIIRLHENIKDCQQLIRAGLERVKVFEVTVIQEKMSKIYQGYMKGDEVCPRYQ